jgi:hypothetical protein
MMTIHATTKKNNETNLWRQKKKRAKPQTKAPAQPANISGLLLILEFFELLSEVWSYGRSE